MGGFRPIRVWAAPMSTQAQARQISFDKGGRIQREEQSPAADLLADKPIACKLLSGTLSTGKHFTVSVLDQSFTSAIFLDHGACLESSSSAIF